jgi:hypothetical protein
MLRAVAAVHFLVGVFGVACAFIASAVGLLLADIAS